MRKLRLNSMPRSQGLLVHEVVMVWTRICLSLKFVFLIPNSSRAVKGPLLAAACYGKTNTEIPIVGLLRFLCHINAPKARWALNEASVRLSPDHNWMLVAAFVFCISNTSPQPAASQPCSGRELGSDMVGTLKESDVSWLCQLHVTSPSCQPLTVGVGCLSHFQTSLTFNSL